MAANEAIPAKTALWIIGGVVALVLVIAIGLSLGDSDGDASDPVPSVALDPEPDDTQPPTAGFDSGIPPIDCRLMMGALRALDALESEEIGFPFSAPGISQGETCTHRVEGHEDYYVTLSPGPTSDFLEGALLLGVEGELVPDVGDVALWFGGADADGGGEVGVLSVAKQIDQGGFYFRVELGRPDLDEDDHRAVAADLGRDILARVPGGQPDPAEPEIETVTPDELTEPDRRSWSYRHNIEGGVDAGDWELADGIISTLEYLLDDQSSLARAPDGVVDRSVSELLAWIDTVDLSADDRAAVDELVDRLLRPDELAYLDTDPRLPTPTDDDEEGDENGDGAEDEVALPATTPGGLVRISAPVQETPEVPEIDCGDGAVWHDAACLAWYDAEQGSGQIPAGKYWVAGPSPTEVPVLGVTAPFVDLVVDAVADAAAVLEPVGVVPEIRVAISPFKGNVEVLSIFDDEEERDWCNVVVWAQPTTTSDAALRQWIAFEMARCFAVNEFPQDSGQEPWWAPALFYYLSEVAVPDGGLEDGFSADFTAEELVTTPGHRKRNNALLFLSMHDVLLPTGIVELIRSAPRSGGVDAHLAGIAGMDLLLHDFAIQASDDQLPDSLGRPYGGGPFDDHDFVITSPAERQEFLEPMGVTRVDLRVDDGMWACVEWILDGDTLLSWREGTSGQPGDWTTDPPDRINDRSLVVATATGSATASIRVDDVVDDPDDCDERDDEPEIEPFEFDLDCPDACGSTEYIGRWIGEQLQKLVDALTDD
ncbi:MAG: hypothetical protein RIB98_11800 [Acidimicrobiales bacterium]